MSFSIDKNENRITIIKNEKKYSYFLEEVESSIYHRQSYQKDLFWNNFSAYSELGYIDLTFKNNDRYYLTSFLVDVTKEPIFENSEIKYSFLPFIDKSNPKINERKLKEKAANDQKRKYERIKSKLIEKTEFELRDIIKNETHIKEAIDIAKEIIKERNL